MDDIFDSNLKILVVDDMNTYRKGLVSFLNELGFANVEAQENGAKGLNSVLKAANTEDPFGLILSDLRMPVMDGVEFLKAIRSHPQRSVRELPFIVTSVVSEQDGILEAIKFGVNDYIIKPVELDVLKSKMHTFFSLHSTRASA